MLEDRPDECKHCGCTDLNGKVAKKSAHKGLYRPFECQDCGALTNHSLY